MNVLDLFAGAVGGWSCGLERAGYRTVVACEIDPWRRQVFAARHPGCLMYADVRDLTGDRLIADLGYLPDVVVGSPPCQQISRANTKGTGITDDHLFWEWVRLVFEIRPVWCAAENSPGARTKGIDGVVDALGQGGYAAWLCVVGAENAGANHERKRMWVVAADTTRIGHSGWRQSERGPQGRNVEYGPMGARDAADADGRLTGGAGRHANGCVGVGAGANGETHPDAARIGYTRRGSSERGPEERPRPAGYALPDAGHAPVIGRLRQRRVRSGSSAEPAQADLYDAADAAGARHGGAEDGRADQGDARAGEAAEEWRAARDLQSERENELDAPDADRESLAIGPRLPRNDGQELPAALRDIGASWPDWNGGLPGLAASCAAAGFGVLDDGAGPGLSPGLRNRAIAALGDAVVDKIPEAVGRAMREAARCA